MREGGAMANPRGNLKFRLFAKISFGDFVISS